MELVDLLTLRAFNRQRRALSRRLSSGPPAEAELRLAHDALGPRERQTIRAQARAARLLNVQFIAPWELPVCLTPVLVPAVGLFVRGAHEAIWRDSLAVVGARRACPHAREWAAEVARAAVGQGLQVVSGGARGIDGAAHDAACAMGGPTLAFIGVGLDRFYPASHRPLFARILECGGAVVSEHPPGEGGRPFDHAARNRFIAALGRSLWVAEAGDGSGTLGTARTALALKRPVWLSPPGVARLRGGLTQLMDEGAREVAQIANTVAESASQSVVGVSPGGRASRRRIEK